MRAFLLRLLTVFACWTQAAVCGDAAYPRIFFQKGLNLTASFEGGGYAARDRCVRMLDEFRSKGVNAIALVAYGFCPRGRPEIRFPGGLERDDDLAGVTALAHARGMRVMLKPQLWIGQGTFPGDLVFAGGEDRARWFGEYRKFLEHYAGLAARMHADILCVGVEFTHLTVYESEWRRLIARARELYRGPLVYGATQGPEFEQLRFWDALDYIGLSNYYPLSDDYSAAASAAKVEAVQRRYRKPVLFVEAGFANRKNAHREPWAEAPNESAPEEQARCYEALLSAFYRKPWFAGVYWWDVGTNGRHSLHSPWGLPAMDVVERWYRHGGR